MNDNIIQNLEKHHKYKNVYKPNTLYWGLGIENELYLEFSKKISKKKSEILKNHKRERYSVDYFSNYKKGIIQNLLEEYLENYSDEDDIYLPLLMNSHSFINTDMFNESKTIYNTKCESNPKYSNETFLDTLKILDPYFFENEENTFIFDGDSIEIVTLNFYNTLFKDVINELKMNKLEFIKHLQLCQKKLSLHSDKGIINWMSSNHPIATFMTNLNNISVFCNGTIHFNLTLPTILNEKCQISNFKEFEDKHKIAIQLIQYMEPFIITLYGSCDPFYRFDDTLSATSQRCAISRYIGIGTYDSDLMLKGKLLTKSVKDLDSFFWYNKYYEKCGYNKLNDIGYDINFNKHYNHGIELRFFDHMNDEKISQSLLFIIYLMDDALYKYNNNIDIDNPIKNKIWNKFVERVFRRGKSYLLTDSEIDLYKKLFNIHTFNSNYISDIFNEIFHYLMRKYINVGLFSNYVIQNNNIFIQT